MPGFTVAALTAVSLMLAVGSAGCARSSEAAAVPDRFRQLVDRPAVLDETENRLIARCMEQAGLGYPKVPAPRDDRPMSGLLRGATPLHAETARQHGYPDRWMTRARDPGKGPVDRYADSLPADTRERFHRLLLGEGGNDVRVVLPGNFEVAAASSGCVGSARRRLYGSVENYLTVYYLPELVQRQASAADEDPDVRDAHAAFARCMAAKGYDTATPDDAVALAATYYPDGRRGRAGADEKTLAAGDAECQTTVRLRERRAAAVDRLARRWLADNEAAVSRTYEVLRSALAEARTKG
ncbi:hypothetical protein OG875_25770 [Streptomyces sp. NBC_01498]|uniref:hypothetical protein n=1 Tax=Streptomyces sp. NBC_01498 TaxID=2975870 RepID=UPI002E7BFE56|nr:hypothetical protein [Streptomyces sp. NBC_01498]WTL27679.1 hypothetical protein OG875_25770 [Streptomyces sp. NBC_01498]